MLLFLGVFLLGICFGVSLGMAFAFYVVIRPLKTALETSNYVVKQGLRIIATFPIEPVDVTVPKKATEEVPAQ